MALVSVGVVVALQVSEFEARTGAAARPEDVGGALLLPLAAEPREDPMGLGDHLFEVFEDFAEEDAGGVFAIVLSVLNPLEQHAVGLAAAPRAAEKNVFIGTVEEQLLRARLRLEEGFRQGLGHSAGRKVHPS